MSMIIDGTNGLTFNNATTQASAGVVLQVVSATYATQTDIINTNYLDTGLSASITPKFSTSKILVIVSQSIMTQRSTNAGIFASLNIVRGSTQIVASDRALGIDAGTNASGFMNQRGMASIQYLDSPATTSSTTYKTQLKASTTANSGQVYAQQGDTTSMITLMEIAV